jgi:hypothetical protein
MGSVHARGDTFLTFGLKALTETNTSRLATGDYTDWIKISIHLSILYSEKTKYYYSHIRVSFIEYYIFIATWLIEMWLVYIVKFTYI